MVSVSASEQGLKEISAMLKGFGEEFPKALPAATRFAANYICDSCRSRTKTAHKYPKKHEYEILPSPNPPRYITWRKGAGPLPIALHRWQLTRKKGTPDQVTRDYFTYCHAKRNKRGELVKDVAAEKAELKKYRLELINRGLAKQSWNWAKGERAHGVGGRGGNVVWRRKHNKRNPKDAVSGRFQAVKSALTSGAEAEIHNRLDYINSACPDSAVSEAVNAAKKKLSWKLGSMLERFINNAKQGVFFGANGYPMFRQDWNALEKQLNPIGYSQAL